jgi:hypothetical protein
MALIGVFLLSSSGLGMALATRAAPVVETLPALTPTPTAKPPVFSATLSLETDRDHLYLGQLITVTADITVSEGCIYPVFELTVKQTESEEPIFEHIEPPGDIITGPIQIPSTWTFRAIQAGTGTFEARTFGERYCGDYWVWDYLYGKSETVVVNWPHLVWLPSVAVSDLTP